MRYCAIYEMEDNYSSQGMWQWGTIVWLDVCEPNQGSNERDRGREREGGVEGKGKLQVC